MSSLKSSLLVSGAAVAYLLPSTAFADLSAQDVWDSWKSFAEISGQTVSVGSQDEGGGTLVLNDVQMNMEFPEGSASSTLEFLEFRERDDGTVAVTMAPDFPFSFSIDPPEGEAVDFAMIMRQSGTSIIASGDPDNIAFDYLASEISVTVDKIFIDGDDINADVQIAMNDIDGKYALSGEDVKSYASDFSAGKLSYTIAFTDSVSDGRFNMDGVINDMQTNSAADLPADYNATDPLAFFDGTASVKGGISAGATVANMSMDGGSDSFSIAATSESSALDVNIGEGSLKYGGSATGVDYVFQAAQLPFPEVNLGFAEVAFNLLMPTGQSETPQDFGFLMRLAGMEISDAIWGMFDPGAIMPRDPATISLDVTGQMNLLANIFDPDVASELDGETPAELHNMQLNDLTVSALGAEATGNGEFTFDNSDLETFDGLPAPTGTANMELVGVNGLMDRLIQMGFLQQDQAMGARMMLGLFARPGVGEDTLTSTIEVNGDGSVFANGQQLR